MVDNLSPLVLFPFKTKGFDELGGGNDSMKGNLFQTLENILYTGEGIPPEKALEISNVDGVDLYTLFDLTNRIREKFKGDEINLCSIINAKSGLCPEDCSFCSQSVHHDANIDIYPLVNPSRIFDTALHAVKNGAQEFSIVTSGKALTDKTELQAISTSLREMKEKLPINRCASLGIMDMESLLVLKDSGLQCYHHNLETARSFFPEVCTTHDYEEDVEAIQVAKKLGFRVCCGGIFGLGETWEQRVELAFTLKELDVDSIPINFLNPIKGTKMEGATHLTPMECLKIIALYRSVHPKRDIFICGGREINLRDLQSMMFLAGANGTMIGNYLTTSGRPPQDDLTMIRSLGLRVKR
jgi:biotin synthase